MKKVGEEDYKRLIDSLKETKRLRTAALMIEGKHPMAAKYPAISFWFSRLEWRLNDGNKPFRDDNWYPNTVVDDLTEQDFTEEERETIRGIIFNVVVREFRKRAAALAEYGIELEEPDWDRKG